MAVKYTKQETSKKSAPSNNENKDRLALLISLLFVAALGFFGLRYFSTSGLNILEKANIVKTDKTSVEETQASEETETVDEQENIIASSTRREGETGNLTGTGTTGTSANTGDESKTVFAQLETWRANDYQHGDVQVGERKVVEGDTLWELAEGAYGNGAEWTRILDANADSIGFLANGQQALIITGQTLVIPAIN